MKMEIETLPGRKKSAPRSGASALPLKPKHPLRFKSLLVPVDFSDCSMKALDFAISIAREFGSQLRLLNVLEPPAVFNSEYPAYSEWDRAATDQAKTQLNALADERIDELIPTSSEVRIGRAYKIICNMARTQQSDLIVIGTHGFTGLKRLLLGSTAEKVIRHAPCSVLVVRAPKGREKKPMLQPKRILVPTDFSAFSRQALHSALSFAEQYNSQVELLNVVPIHYSVSDFDQVDYRVLEAELKEAGEKRLAALSKALGAKKIPVVTRLREGRPATEITEAARELGSDLIVISTHGHTGWQRALLGSTTEEVVRHAPCPVLIIRSK